jgi:hypothetical protein
VGSVDGDGVGSVVGSDEGEPTGLGLGAIDEGEVLGVTLGLGVTSATQPANDIPPSKAAKPIAPANRRDRLVE